MNPFKLMVGPAVSVGCAMTEVNAAKVPVGKFSLGVKPPTLIEGWEVSVVFMTTPDEYARVGGDPGEGCVICAWKPPKDIDGWLVSLDFKSIVYSMWG